MSIEICPIQMSHIEGYHKTLDTVAKERRYLTRLEAPPLEATREFVKNNIENDQSQLVALDGSSVVGWCDILTQTSVIRRHVGVLGMGFLPAYRGRGLGQQLLSRTLADSQRQGFSKIELTVMASNERAIHLYCKLGFVLEGTLKNNVLIDGKFDSTLCMALFPESTS